MFSGPRALDSASEASDYMLHEYLVRNDKAHRTANRWHGGGAEALGLPERVSRRRFVEVLEGHVPGTDIRLGRVVDGEHQHRPGWDCTFSAPKSVSLEALLHDNKAVMRAHDASVRAALDWMEAEFLQTRGYDPATGRRPRVKADGLVAATFRHVASRNNDPQLHTHAVIANMTRNAAGEWRSVEPTLLQRNRRLIGAWYRNDLARRLGEMGYVLVPTQVGGLPSFELAGYSPAMLEAFSTRRGDILDYMAERGWDYSAKTAQAATLHTRKRKDEPAPGELSAMWKARAEALGLARDADEVRLDRTERGFARPPARFTPLEAVWQATDHLEERHAVFGESDLLAAALGREPGRHTHVDLQSEIVRLREDGHLVAAGDGALTTRRTLRAEKEVVRRMREGKGTARPLAPEEEVAGRLAATELTEGQKEAVRLILRSPDPVVGVQGFAGTGKTRMLNEVATLAGGRQVFGLAPSAAAARVLGVEGGIGATTLQWLLTRYGSIADRIDVRTHSGRALRFAVDDDDLRHIDHAWSSTVYRAQGLTRDNVIAVLDSASMMSDRAMLYVEMSRARDGFVLLTDDTEQLVSRLEREGETVSSALEAAGQAPWLEPDMAVTEKPALWPVLADWRAHVQRAEKADVPPFHLVGCDALMARMGALAEKEALPGALAEVLEEHRPFAEDRALVSDWTSSMLETAGRRERMLAEAAAAGTAVTSLPGHAAWSRRAEGALEEGVELEDEDRYGVHLDRIAGARAQLGEPLGELGRALEFDGNAASLQSEWRARERGEGDRSLEDFAARIAALAREAAPGEMPPDLSRAADEIAERQREAEERRRKEEERRRKEEERRLAERKARDAQSALEALARERTQLFHAAALEPVAKWADWQDWRDRAEPAMAEASKVAEDAALSYSVQDGAAKAFVKNELAMREKMSDRAQLLDKTKTLLEECQQERDRAATGDLPFVRQENYGAWRYKAQLAVDNAKSMLADEAGNAPFFKENPDLRQTLAAWRPLDRTMWEEREDWERIERERAEQKSLERRRDRSQGISM